MYIEENYFHMYTRNHILLINYIFFLKVAVLTGHSGMITSINFCPIVCNDVYYLVSTSTDGSVAFWSHTKKPKERAVFQ